MTDNKESIADRDLIALGAMVAGSQAKLAEAIGYSARVISNANHGTPLSADARGRIARYARTRQPVVDPGMRVLGRKPVPVPANGVITIGLLEQEWEAIRVKLMGESMKGWISRVVRSYLDGRKTLPEPEALPEATIRRRQRLDEDVIAALTRRGKNVEARPYYVRMAVLAELGTTT